MCFAYIKHTILLNLRAWVQTFFRSFFEPATLLAIFSSRLTFGMIFDDFDSPMAPFWPRVARQIFPPPALQALVNGNVSPRKVQGVPIGPTEPSEGFKCDPNDTKNEIKPNAKQEHLATHN